MHHSCSWYNTVVKKAILYSTRIEMGGKPNDNQFCGNAKGTCPQKQCFKYFIVKQIFCLYIKHKASLSAQARKPSQPCADCRQYGCMLKEEK